VDAGSVGGSVHASAPIARWCTQDYRKWRAGGSAARAERSGAGRRATVAALMAEDKPAGCMRGGTAGLCRVSLLFCHRPNRFEAPIKVVGCQFAIVGPHSQHRRLILQEQLRRV